MRSVLHCVLLVWCLWAAPITAQPEAAAPASEKARIARAQFTTGIVDREPVDRALVVSPPVRNVYFFTDLRHMEGDTVTHNWYFGGELISRKSFVVGGPRWRVFSKVLVEPQQAGEWSVTVTDGGGWPLHTELFRYRSAQAGQALE
jgi:hypothetical protein